jgi:prevent-host-death family protein
MHSHSVAEAKDRLSELVDLALGGEGVVITRDGRPVVELKPIESRQRRATPPDLAWLSERRVGRIPEDESAGDLLSKLRDEGER